MPAEDDIDAKIEEFSTPKFSLFPQNSEGRND